MAILEQKQIYDDSKKAFTQLEKDLDTINKEVVTLTKSSKELAKALALVKKSNDGTEAKKLAEGTDKLTKSTKKLKNALTAEEKVKQDILKQNAKLAQSRTKAAKDLALVRQKTLQANKALRDQAKAALGVKKSFAGLGKQLIGAAGLLGGITALVGIVKDAFKIFVEFQKASSKLAAILGKNKDEIKALTEQAKLLGSTTAFTASQVISLQIELGKLGFSLREIEASTPGILDLAAATGTDLAAAAELAGATLRIFNLDASEMQRVTDVLALSTTKSSLSMEKLATILPTVGKTAQIAGVSLEKTAALAGTLTDRGLDASSAATSLRNIFLELSKKGITWNEAMQQINESTDKNKTSMDLFGKRAAAAGVVLSETAGSTDELTTALNNANGAAQEMAETMLDNLAGDITKASSAWEGFILSLEDGDGVISKLIRGVVQDFIDFLGQLTLFNEVSIVNKLKLIANAALSLFDKAFMPLLSVLELLGIEVPKFRFEIEKTTEVIDENTEAVDKNTDANEENEKSADELEKSKQRLIAANGDLVDGNGKLIKTSRQIQTEYEEEQKRLAKLAAAIQKEIDLRIKRNIAALARTEKAEEFDSDIDDQIAFDQAKLEQEQEFQDKKAVIQDVAANDALLKAQDWEDAKLAIQEQALNSGVQLANDIFSNFQDERLAELNSQAEAEKAILQDKLDKGVISEQQFTDQIAAIEKKQRIESAKADKKKALFDIAIRTAIAIISALASVPPNVPLSIAVGVIGGIQAAAVLARPIPKFAEGTEFVQGEGTGTSDSVHAMLSKGERVVPAEINSMLNNIPNSDLPGLLNNKQDSNMFLGGLLMQGNKHSQDLITLMSNMGWTYERRGEMIINKADGSLIEKFNING